MTHSQTDTTYTTTSGPDPAPATSDVAKDQARNVGQTAANAGSQVASTAADEAKHVAGEAKAQVTNVVSQSRQQVTQTVQDQARNGQQKAAQGLTAIAGELRSMADNTQASGPATDLVRQATGKVEEFADWLQVREPGDLVQEVRSFARRRPGAFLFGALVAGVVAGRLTTGVVAAHKDSGPSSPQAQRGTTGRENWVQETYPATTPAYGTDYATQATPAYTDSGYAAGYGQPATGTVPPPPYGTVPPVGSVVPPTSPAGWDDPQRGMGQGGQQ